MNSKGRTVLQCGRIRRRRIPPSLLLLLGLMVLPVWRIAEASVTVDQVPLTVQQSLAPNIVLMLDDSGSMAWDVMPDYGYLSDTSSAALVSSSVNGLYYDPVVTYNPPFNSDGVSRYSNSSFTDAWISGFDQSGTRVDLRSYDGSSDTSRSGQSSSDIGYSVAIDTTPSPVAATVVCPSGYAGGFNSSGNCRKTSGSGSAAPTSITCPAGTSTSFSTSANVWQCVYPTALTQFFTYTVKSGNSYTRHYVGTSGSCATAALSTSVCHEDSTVRQNVANWFSYYRTRILMAKSGLMNAFASLESTIRFGFGSIDGGTQNGNRNYLNLPSLRYSYSDTYNNGTNYIAKVVPFGDGSSGTQKAQFWNWVDNAVASGGTPLRQALNAVGNYYQTAQPWQTSTADTTELACRQSYTILTSDGFWNDSSTGLPTTPFTTNVDNLVITTNTSSLDTRPAFCASAGYTLNTTNSANLGQCVLSGPQGTSTPSCSTSPWTSLSNSGSVNVACAANPVSKTPTCSRSNGTYNSSNGTCSRGQVVCESNPWTTLTGSGAGTTCVASPATRTPTCPAGYTLNTNNSSSNPGLCIQNGTETPSCPVASNPSSPSYTLTNTNSAQVNCERTLSSSSSSSSYTQTGSNGQSYTYTAGAPYADSYSDTLADSAMYYWLSDLRPSSDNKVPTSTEDPAFWQHMTTFTLGLGFTPTGISPNGTTIDQIFNWANGGTAINNFSWPQPTANSINNIADLAHAAVNGHGGFYSATSPDGFSNGIKDALKRVNERIGTGASLAANSTKLETGTTTYQAVYYTGRWKGDLKAFSVNPTTGVISSTPNWIASSTGVFPAAASRTIKTYNPSLAAGSREVSFSSPSNLSADQQTALGATTTAQQAVISYLRGDASNELKNGGSYRNRDTALGDIVDSQPVFVGAPDPNVFFGRTFTGSSDYPAFAANKLSRAPRIWVAANDGMVHSFDANTGAEVFAFLPDAVIRAGIKNISDPAYGGNSVPHQYFNDGELAVADVYYSSAWHTVLVGTTGRGPAKAVYALDVTNPAAPTVLWERSATDGLTNSNYIGQVTGRPVVAQTANGTWSVLMGNGYNSTSGRSALLKFDIQSGTLSVYTTDTTSNNGLAPPAVLIGNIADGISTKAYAGDLTGKVWEFGLAGTTGTSVYSARDADGAVQPITAGMLAGKDPLTGNLWLFFGTGRYLAQTELSDTSIQTWYGIIVQSSNSSLVSNLSSGRAALREREIVAEQSATSTRVAARAISSGSASDMVGKSGWYTDLVLSGGTARGERMVNANQFQGSLLIGTTRIPESSDPCSPSGSGWIMAINPFTGTAPDSTFFDINNDGQFNSSDTITIDGTTYVVAGVGFSSIPNNPIFVGNTMLISFDNASTGSINTRGTVGALRRQSWRELVAQ